MLLTALLLAAAAPAEVPFQVEPDFSLQVNELSLPIYCSENPAELAELRQRQNLAIKKAKPLRAKRQAGVLPLSETRAVYSQDLLVVTLSFAIVTREHAAYLCKHPEIWPKPEKEPGV